MEQQFELRGPWDRLDDVVVTDVSMVRAEMLDDSSLWLACYLSRPGRSDTRIAFDIRCSAGKLTLAVSELPEP